MTPLELLFLGACGGLLVGLGLAGLMLIWLNPWRRR